jgi:hypothetical protein
MLLFFSPTMLCAQYAPNESCATCHPIIAKEYQRAMHAHATIFKDPIHKAAWEKSPSYKKKYYDCGRCHTPADDEMMKKLDANQSVMPDINNKKQNDAVSCAYCHRIKSIKHDQKQNYNITNATKHLYYGNLDNPMKNEFHKSEKNINFQNGNVCIGCHSHFKNDQGINVCSTNQDNELDSANCVSCHMPQVDGPPSTQKNRKQHSFHGFAGIHNDITMLSQYVDIELLKGIDRFFIAINSKTPHALTLHPMRKMQMRVSVTRNEEQTSCIEQDFIRVIGKDQNMTLPWHANTILQNTSIKANEKRVSTYMYKLLPGDKVSVQIGYYLLGENIAKNLGLDEHKQLQGFKLLKHKTFIVK